MKPYTKTILILLLFVCTLQPFPVMVSAQGEGWLDGWDYRTQGTITGSVGAGTDYQVFLNMTYKQNMQTDFDDIRFTDDDGTTLLDYWLERKTDSSYAQFWIEVTDSLETDSIIWMYYGNSTVSSISDGDATFQEFFDKDDETGWSATDITVSTSGNFLLFYNPTEGSSGTAERWDLTTTGSDFEVMARLKTVSLGLVDQCLFILGDGSQTDRFAQYYTPYDTAQTEWYYYDGSQHSGGTWTEGTEFIFSVQVDVDDSATGIDLRRYDASHANLLDSALGVSFTSGSPTVADGILIGDGSTSGTVAAYYRWIAFRKCIDTEPTIILGDWNEVGSAVFIFPVGWDPAAQFGYDSFFIFLGLIMLPLSTMYLVRGGRKEMNTDKLFFGLIIFVLGIGFFIGGILP